MRKTSFHILVVALLVAGISTMFQNCSQPQHHTTESAASIEDFGYPYSTKPAIFADSLILLKPDPNPSHSFLVRVFLANPADETLSSGTLQLSVVDEAGRLICPTEYLDLSTQTHDWTVDCIPPFAFTTASVTLSLSGTPGNFSYTRSYSF